jgi:hypothetical protein
MVQCISLKICQIAASRTLMTVVSVLLAVDSIKAHNIGSVASILHQVEVYSRVD